jgi:Fe-S cluster assembly protein SufD
MSRVNPVYRQQVGHYQEQHLAFAASRESDPSWLVELRADAMARFAEQGFPSTRLEEWRYTNVAPIAKLELDLARACDLAGGAHVEPLEALVRRAPDEARSRLGGVIETKDRPFALLATAFLSEGVVVTIPRNVEEEALMHLELPSPAAGEVRHPRVLIGLEPGSRATVVLDHVQGERSGGGLTNLVAEIEVGANASLELVILQREGDDSFHVSNLAARVARDGRFTSHTVTAGGALVRNDLEVLLGEEGAACDLRGLFLGRGSRLVDNHTAVDHAVPHCNSRELYKGILGEHSKGIFRGRVVVRPDAQKTDATQSNPNLLLGDHAEIDTKPQLEIYADDVKCSHGATIGQLDEDALFYLRSRGIGREDARELLIRAFANEIIEALPVGDEIAAGLRRAVEGGTTGEGNGDSA